uniref:Protein kinase domain-containing protein n=1 Tax=Fagus sylvatica TaxID=28930 RepID=A0A2N9G8D7_FAGSY
MGRFKHFIAALFGGLALILLVHAQDQSDFISIDCGLQANWSYTEPSTSINYISDAAFIDTGVSKKISSEFEGDFQQPTWTLRSFPEGIRNCYSINVTQGQKYLIRATFLYGNYDGQNLLPQFDLHLGPNMWDTVKIENNVSYVVLMELIHVPSLNYLQVCLVNTGLGTPFISAIEFRPLNNRAYVTSVGSLALFARYDLGSVNNKSYRYKDDVYDRTWAAKHYNKWKSLSTLLTIDSEMYNPYWVPSVVMSTAATPINESGPLEFYLPPEANSKYYVYMHFAELVKLKANQSRSFNITLNGELWYDGTVVPSYLFTNTLFSPSALTGGNYVFSIFKTENSTLPPIINAIEIYTVKHFPQSETDKQDVVAITNIKSKYGVERNWQGDPCAPQAYSWEGLNCSYDGYNPPRIISLDLSSNSLTGSVPDFLSQLKYLRVLNLERNQLTGSIPAEFIQRAKKGSLSLNVDENSIPLWMGFMRKEEEEEYCGSNSSINWWNVHPSHLTVMAILWGLRSRKKQDTTKVAKVDIEPKVENQSLESIQRQFTYPDLQRITNNFERILGKGGFGKVYHGFIDGYQVAVKMLSQTSGENTNILSWEARLQIAMDAAQGLEYLQHGCKPPIIHRDVKSTNILLNEKFHAKLADFGLSKTFPTDATHLSTVVAGTPGYLDPE